MNYYISFSHSKYRLIQSVHNIGFLKLRLDTDFIIQIDVETFYKFIYGLKRSYQQVL